MNYIDELEMQIHNFVKVNHKEPSIILIHPNTYYDIEDEAAKYIFINHQANGYIKKYRGIKVKRSLDVKIGEIEVY